MKIKIVLLCLSLLLFLSSQSAVKATIIFVDSSAAGANNGTSWANAYTMLSTALTAAQTDTAIHSILVAKGHYYPTGVQSGTNRDSFFMILRGGIRLYGGYPAGGGIRNPALNSTILDGNINLPDRDTDNSAHVLVIFGLAADADSVVVDGFTIQNGYAGKTAGTGSTASMQLNVAGPTGGGILISTCNNGRKVTVRNCSIIYNTAKQYQAGAYPNIINMIAYGGGIGIAGAAPLIINCRISGNKIDYGLGAGICAADYNPLGQMKPLIVNCIVSGNKTVNILNAAALATMSNSMPSYINCTIAGNNCAAIYDEGFKLTSFVNCIISGNLGGVLNNSQLPTAIDYSLSSNGFGSYNGTGNVTGSPLFVNAPAYATAPFTGGDYHLQAGSPAINMGSNPGVSAIAGADLDGNARIQGGMVDAGAYEYFSGVPNNASITGISGICLGYPSTLTGTPAGGIFSSSNPAVATVNGTTGLVTGVTAGTAVVTYTNGTASTTLAITVSAPPSAAITGSSTGCLNTYLLLTGATPGGIWSSSTPSVANFYDPSSGHLTSYAVGTTNVTYTVVTTGCTVTDTKTIAILAPPPAPTISGNVPVCVGSTIVMTSGTPGGRWVSISNKVAVDTFSGAVTGVAAGTAFINYSITANGCSSMSTASVTVLPKPVVSPITGNSAVCAGSMAALSNATGGGVWSSANPAVATVSSTGVVTGVSAGIDSIRYTVTNANGCSTTVSAIVNVASGVSVAPITGSTALCAGATVQLSNATPGGVWSSADNSVASVSNAGVVSGVAAGAVTMVYKVTANGCTDSASAAVIIKPLPVVPAIAGSSTVCANTTSLLSNDTLGGAWTSSNPAVATVSSTGVVSGVGAGIDTIVYTVTNAAGCATAVSTVITVNALPAVAPLVGITDICTGSTTTLSSATAGGLWSSTNSSVATVSSAGLVTGAAAGTADIHYTVTTNGCSAFAGTPVTVHPLPVPVITANGALLITASYASYSWKRNGLVLSGAVSQSYTATQNGSYSVTVTDANGCTGTSAPVDVKGLGIAGTPDDGEIRIYPNPAHSVVHIDAAAPVGIVVCSPDGRVLIQESDAKAIDVSSLPDDVYIISVYTHHGILAGRERLVKMR